MGYQFTVFNDGVLTVTEAPQSISSSVEAQMQAPNMVSNTDMGFTVTYIDNEGQSQTTSEDTSSQKQPAQTRKRSTRINDTSTEDDAALRLVEADLLEIEQPIIDFYDLCSYNIKYCQ